MDEQQRRRGASQTAAPAGHLHKSMQFAARAAAGAPAMGGSAATIETDELERSLDRLAGHGQ